MQNFLVQNPDESFEFDKILQMLAMIDTQIQENTIF